MPESGELDPVEYGFEGDGTAESRGPADAACTTDPAGMTLGLENMATGLGKLLEVEHQQFMADGPGKTAGAMVRTATARSTPADDPAQATDATDYGF